MELAERKCEACAPGTLPIDEARVWDLHSHLDPFWRVEGAELRRTFRFKNFRDPFDLATKIALVAEQEGHHPDLAVGWGYLRVRLTTHEAKGLTDNDFILAAKIDGLV